MPNDVERRESQIVHDRQLILRGRALAIDLQFCVAGIWFIAVALATQVRRDHCVMFGQFRCDLVPLNVGLGVPVQQQQPRSLPSVYKIDRYPVRKDARFHEVLKHGFHILQKQSHCIDSSGYSLLPFDRSP